MKKKINLLQIIIILQVICSLGFSVYVHTTKLLPTKYEVLMIVAEVILLIIGESIVLHGKKKAIRIVGAVAAILVMIGMVVGGIYLYKTRLALEDIANVSKEKTEVSVYVYDDDQAQSIEEAKDYTFGIMKELDRDNTDKAIEKIESKIGTTINTVEYDGLSELADAMMDNKIQSIIINEGYLDVISDLSQDDDVTAENEDAMLDSGVSIARDYEGYVSSLRKLAKYSLENEVAAGKANPNGTFIMYISGIDTFGNISAKSRSDVNIMAVVNPNTKQILLVSTPRDYYVPLSISNGAKDKLTHAGIYGIQCSCDTLEMLYDVNVDYYFRVNFSGFEDIINALGGVTVWSDYTFDVEPDFHYVKGDNYLNGIQALAFARERYSFANGDNQRGTNQMNVIISVFNKATSSAVLSNYTELLDSLNGSFETNMPYDDLATLVRQQLSEGTGWNIDTYSVSGSGKRDYTYSISGRTVYVTEPNMDTVNEAKEKITEVLNAK